MPGSQDEPRATILVQLPRDMGTERVPVLQYILPKLLALSSGAPFRVMIRIVDDPPNGAVNLR